MTTKYRIRRILLVCVALCLWMAISACSCGNALSRLTRPTVTIPTLAPTRQMDRVQKPPTLPPTPPPTTRPRQAGQAATETPSTEQLLPNDLDRSVDMQVTEDQLNKYLAEQSFSAEGAEIEDIQATITAEDVIVTFAAKYEPLNLNAGVTVKGIPVVVDGQAYIQIQDIALDSSVPALTRMLAQVAIEQALAQRSRMYA